MIYKFHFFLLGIAVIYFSLAITHDKILHIIPQIIQKLKKLGTHLASKEKTSYRDKTLTVLNLEGRKLTLPEVMELERSTKGVEFVRSLMKLEKH